MAAWAHSVENPAPDVLGLIQSLHGSLGAVVPLVNVGHEAVELGLHHQGAEVILVAGLSIQSLQLMKGRLVFILFQNIQLQIIQPERLSALPSQTA